MSLLPTLASDESPVQSAYFKLDEGIALLNLAFLAIVLLLVGGTLVWRWKQMKVADRWLFAALILLLATLTGEYVTRWSSYHRQNEAYLSAQIVGDQTDIAPAFGHPVLDMSSARGRVASTKTQNAVRLARAQSFTTVLFSVFTAALAWRVLRGARDTKRQVLHTLLVAGVSLSIFVAAFVWVSWSDVHALSDPNSWITVWLSVGPGVTMMALGVALVRQYRTMLSMQGVLLSSGAVLYGAVQFLEIVERKIDLFTDDSEAEQIFLFSMLALAFALRAMTVFAVVKLPFASEDRDRISDWMEQMPGGAVFAKEEGGRLVIREPDAGTLRLPLDRLSADVYALDLDEVDGGEWGISLRTSSPNTREFLVSPPSTDELYRVLKIRMPDQFVGGDTMILTFEEQSVVRFLPRAGIGLALLRGEWDKDAADMPIWWCNEHVARLFGATPEELRERTLRSLVHADWSEQLEDMRRRDYSSVLIAVGGENVGERGAFLRITACPFGDHQEDAEGHWNQPLLVMVSSLSSDSHTHTDFLLHNLSHTLRTPIALVKGGCDAAMLRLKRLSDTPRRENVMKSLQSARAEAARLQKAVDLNLQVGRDLIRRGEEPKLFSIEEFVRDLLNAYERVEPRELGPTVRSGSAKLAGYRAEIGSYVNLIVEGDCRVSAHSEPLEVVLRELVENAMHYSTPAVPPCLRVQRTELGARITIENDVDEEHMPEQLIGLRRDSQGLSCVRFLSVRYGYPFQIRLDRQTRRCVANVDVASAPAPPPEPSGIDRKKERMT